MKLTLEKIAALRKLRAAAKPTKKDHAIRPILLTQETVKYLIELRKHAGALLDAAEMTLRKIESTTPEGYLKAMKRGRIYRDAAPERCESGCKRKVTAHDEQGVPLCKWCAKQLEIEAS